MIKRDHAPKRIYQWGSVLDAEKFDENSDIDIAVQGVASAQAYFDMLGSAMKMTRFSVDMVDLDKVDDLSRAAILDRARMVYEQA